MNTRSKIVSRLAIFAVTLGEILLVAGCASSTSPDKSVTQTPVINLAPGTYTSAQTVIITDPTGGATIYYTTDGSTPTSSSPTYSSPITVSKTEVINANAIAPGDTVSAVATAAYTINPTMTPTPTFSPGSGTYTSSQSVSISDAAGATIYYTTDGSTPTTMSKTYSGPIIVSATETLSAIAVESGDTSSNVATAAYTINSSPVMVSAPTFSPAAGSYTSSQSVTLSDSTSGATIYYTTNGSTPTTSSTVYSGPITVSASETINAIATAPGYNPSSEATAAYTVSGAGGGGGSTPPSNTTPTPVFSPAAGSYVGKQTVTITDPGATIYYTDDGTPATTSSNVYSVPFTVTSTETFNAIAVIPGEAPSSDIAATFTITGQVLPTPTFSLAAGTYSGTQQLTLTDSPGASIYYTTDGSTPPTSPTSILYTGPITISATETIAAAATSTDNPTSPVGTETFTITAAGPSISGMVLSGTSPVNGAQVQLYGAGQSGYGAAAAPIGSAVTTSASGAFTVNFTCPASPNDLVYLVATGGDAGSGPNTSLQMMTAVGSCNSLSANAQVTINEVTTIASVYALSQFTTFITSTTSSNSPPVPSVGSSSANYLGLTNAFKTVANMVTLASGQALLMTPFYASNPVPFLNSSTVPQARIYTLADILNTCTSTGTNSSSSACSSLFVAATPPSTGTAPTTTAQAALNIAQNPGTAVVTLYDLLTPPASAPFTPMLPGAPGDWTLALTFTGGGLGIDPALQTQVGFIENVGMTIDANGNIYVSAVGSQGGVTVPNSNMLALFDNLGEAQTPMTTVNTAVNPPVVTYGGFENNGNGLQTGTLFLDQSANLYIQDVFGIQIFATSPALSEVVSDGNDPAYGLLNAIVDATGNLWGETSDPFSLAEVTSSDGSGTTLQSLSSGFGLGQNPTLLAFDSNNNLWGVSRSDSRIYLLNSSSLSLTATYSNPSQGTPVADSLGNIYLCGQFGNGINVFNASNTSGPVATYTPATGCNPGSLILDGLGNLWTYSNVDPIVLVEIKSSNGNVITPATGYTGTSSTEPNVFLGGTTSIDGSGNLWVLGSTSENGATGNVLTEFVGLAAPVVNPLASALANNQLATRP